MGADRFHSYLYGHSVTVVADHAAVQAILETPNPSGKHARWWTKVSGTGLKDIKITYRAGRLNNADALSRSPCGEMPAEGEVHDEVQVCHIQSQATLESEPADDKSADVTDLRDRPPLQPLNKSFADEQRKDPEIVEMINFLQRGKLPTDDQRARQIVLQKPVFTMEEGMLFYLDPKQGHQRRVVVPRHLRQQLLVEHHSSPMGGHFAARKTYGALMRHWWWDGMYRDTLTFTPSALPLLAPHSCLPTFSDCWSGCDGIAKDRERESICPSISGLLDQMAICIPYAQSEIRAHSPVAG